MLTSKDELRKKIENADFCIWLFKKYKCPTADYITDYYCDIKRELIEKCEQLFGEEKGDEKFDNLWN